MITKTRMTHTVMSTAARMPKTHVASVTISLPDEPSDRRMEGDSAAGEHEGGRHDDGRGRGGDGPTRHATLLPEAPRARLPLVGRRPTRPPPFVSSHDTRAMRQNGVMDYVRAAQPRIVALFLVTVLAALLLCGSPAAWRYSWSSRPPRSPSAARPSLNNVIERDVDRRMERTRRRPTASGRIQPARAALAGLAAVAAGAAALWAVAGGLAALFALLGAFYYVVVYTLLLKPRTALSAVPGGLAGVFPALIGWAATGAAWSGTILFLCVLIPVWSPPHSWALTLALGDDYRASGIPTPPTRYGDDAARAPLIAGFVAGLSVVLGGAAWSRPLRLRRRHGHRRRAALGIHREPARAPVGRAPPGPSSR